MHTILYLGPTTDLDYERGLLEEWGKRCVQLATCMALPSRAQLAATGTDAVVAISPEPDPLRGVDAVVIERGELDAEDLASHPNLSVVVLLDDHSAHADVEAATKANVWVTRATNRSLLRHVPFASKAPGHSTRRHALQDALAGVMGERPSGRINEL